MICNKVINKVQVVTIDDYYDDAAAATDDDNDDDNDMMAKRKLVAKLTNSFFDVFPYSGVFLRLIMDI